MMPRFSLSAIAITLLANVPAPAVAADLLSQSAHDRLGVQQYWHMRLPLADGEALARVALVDDNLYALTDTNKAFAVHTRTGVLRWATLVADEGVPIRGPSHSDQYVFFTTPGAARVFDRRTGDLASEPRTLRGVIIDVAHDTATVTVGQAHGVRNGDILGVYRLTAEGELEPESLAQLKITAIDMHLSKGRLVRYDKHRRPRSGDRVRADVNLPLEKVKLPFAASSPAVADGTRIYFGAANQRFYSLDILSGFQHWQLLTPKTVSSTPVLREDDLYIAGLDGRVFSCTKEKRKRNWAFQTEGPVFADLVTTNRYVLAASSDRSLYCLDRRTGRRIWRERFDTPLGEAPIVSQGRVYQWVPQEGLFVLDLRTGRHLWNRPQGGRFLVQFGRDAYLLSGEGTHRLVRVEVDNGREKALIEAGLVAFAEGSREDQCILLASRTGELTCLRSNKAPRLKPAQLVEVLRNDRKVLLQKELDAKRRAELEGKRLAQAAAKKKRLSSLFEDEWLRSRKTGRPVGGHGLIDLEGEAVDDEVAEEAEDDDEEMDEDEEDADDEDEDEADEDDEDEDDEDADEDDEDEADEDDEDEDDEDGDEDDEDDDD